MDLVADVIFCFHHLSSFFLSTFQQDDYISSVLQEFTNFPPHPILLKTAIKFLGECAPWLEGQPSQVSESVRVILSSLQNKEFIQVAAEALYNITDLCSHMMNKDFVLFFGVVKPLILSLDVDIESRCILMRSACHILNHLPKELLQQILLDIVEALVEGLTQGKLQVDEKHLFANLKLFSAIFMLIEVETTKKEFEPPLSHPLIVPMQMLLPHLESILMNFSNSDSIVEICSKIIKYSLTNLKCEFYLQFLPNTLTLISTTYCQTNHPNLLNTFSVAIGVFQDKRTCLLFLKH
eukprot:TRINITY_DN1118_c0_g3_i2.p1 TRINITY_DN1118_c0_g3~~TRINITY_DN1118_c0_g3_i2.p1  ORF type:complete len:294 (-),score=59.50 TRINITY_DN1118_c0_g3_i2:20-901(-)